MILSGLTLRFYCVLLNSFNASLFAFRSAVTSFFHHVMFTLLLSFSVCTNPAAKEKKIVEAAEKNKETNKKELLSINYVGHKVKPSS